MGEVAWVRMGTVYHTSTCTRTKQTHLIINFQYLISNQALVLSLFPTSISFALNLIECNWIIFDSK